MLDVVSAPGPASRPPSGLCPGAQAAGRATTSRLQTLWRVPALGCREEALMHPQGNLCSGRGATPVVAPPGRPLWSGQGWGLLSTLRSDWWLG